MVNKEQLHGQWFQIKGKIKERWGKLTEDDLTQINGQREQLLGKLQVRYGIAKQKAEEELLHFEKTLRGASNFDQEEKSNFKKSEPNRKSTERRF